MTPTQKDDKWFIVHHGSEIAGPFETNADAWRWIDVQEGQPLSKAEDLSAWRFKLLVRRRTA